MSLGRLRTVLLGERAVDVVLSGGPRLAVHASASGIARGDLMRMLMALNAAMLAALVVTVWRLRQLQKMLLADNRRDDSAVRHNQKATSVARPGEQAIPRVAELDDFPEESTLAASGARGRRARS